MKTQYRFELARSEDDTAIRRLLRENPVPGQLSLTYEREPDYWAGCSVLGHTCQTLVARSQDDDQVVGVATRSVRTLFVNGQPEEVGYIGGLRVDQAHRGRWLVPLGFRLFHDLHRDSKVTGYITTIIEGNTEAEGILVAKARHHYPAYRSLDRLLTLALILRRPRWTSPATFEVLGGGEVELNEIIDFLNHHGSSRQFFPVYCEADFYSERTRDFAPADFVVACRGSEILGVMGLWDQSGYKQSVVQGYGDNLTHTKVFYNLAAKLLGARPLTPIGQPISFAYASFVCIADDDPVIYQALLQALCNMAAERGLAFLMLGLSTRDPLLPSAQKWLHLTYPSTLYSVCWPGDERWHQRLDNRIPAVEIATL